MQPWERETSECERENIDFPESSLSLNSSPWKSLPRTITRVLWPRKSNPNWTSSLSGHLTGYLWKASLISSASAAWGQTRGTIVPAHMSGRERFPHVQAAQNPTNRSSARITTKANCGTRDTVRSAVSSHMHWIWPSFFHAWKNKMVKWAFKFQHGVGDFCVIKAALKKFIYIYLKQYYMFYIK